MNKCVKVILLALVVIAMSCSHRAVEEDVPSPKETDSVDVNVPTSENIYRYQTDRVVMLNSLVRYNAVKGEYVFDLSEEDATQLGYTLDEYRNVQKQVEYLNLNGVEGNE